MPLGITWPKKLLIFEVIKLNRYHALEVRKGFGKFQGDLYFTKALENVFLNSESQEGYPAMMELADGTRVARGEREWQYWKFAWRHSICMSIICLLNDT